MRTSRYCYPLCIQLPAFNDLNDPAFLSALDLLQERGFYGVELNLLDFESLSPEELCRLLEAYQLKPTMVATGARAKRDRLSLSSPDEVIRSKSVAAMREMVSYAQRLHAGVICGFIKGGPDGDRTECSRQLQRSLDELAADGTLQKAPVYLEATNHYEALLVNTLAEGAVFAQHTQGPICILPDTYHMNIEERSAAQALALHQSLYQNLHISDNNRFFPGLGAIDFHAVLRLLQGLRYQGTITIEGRVRANWADDVSFSCDYLEQVARRICDFEA